ncbi:MAG: hypothetical protein FWB78_04035 [Treponema sp.]|nr:hypothetical protein [Treponema sp.]
MPWRLIKFIAIFVVFLLFIVFNLGNRSDISLGFHTFSDVPVFLTAFFAFILGMLLTLPFIISQWLKPRKGAPSAKKADKTGKKGTKKEVADKHSDVGQEEPRPAEFKDYGID